MFSDPKYFDQSQLLSAPHVPPSPLTLQKRGFGANNDQICVKEISKSPEKDQPISHPFPALPINWSKALKWPKPGFHKVWSRYKPWESPWKGDFKKFKSFLTCPTYFLPNQKIGLDPKNEQKYMFIKYVIYHWKAYGKEISKRAKNFDLPTHFLPCIKSIPGPKMTQWFFYKEPLYKKLRHQSFQN